MRAIQEDFTPVNNKFANGGAKVGGHYLLPVSCPSTQPNPNATKPKAKATAQQLEEVYLEHQLVRLGC